MDDGIDAVKHRLEGSISQVKLVKCKAWLAPQHSQVALLEQAGIVGDEGIDAGDQVAIGAETLAQVRTDKTGLAKSQPRS